MSLVNIYLEASPLTSSGNKLIQDSAFINSFERLSCSKRNRGLEIPPNCLTENKILLESKFDVDRDDYAQKKYMKLENFLKDGRDISQDDYIVMKKKKKKTKKQLRSAVSPVMHDSYRSKSRSRSPGEKRYFGDYKKKMLRSRGVKKNRLMSQIESCEAEGEMMPDGREAYCLGEVMLDCSETDDCLAQPAVFGASMRAQPAVFGASVRAQPATVGAFGPAQPSAFSASVRGRCLFGSSPGQGFSFGDISAEALSLGSNAFTLGKVQDILNIPETFISKMPTYELKTLKLSMEMQREIFSLDMRSSSLSENSISILKEKKMHLLSVVSMALMYSSNLKNENDTYRQILDRSANDVRLFDPEFILKVALYARQELHIRTVTNFLLSYAAIHANTRIYLEKYFEACIVIPSDWIQVAEYYQVLNSKSPKLYLPAVLRRAMKKTFLKFDQYQLAKYNKKTKSSKKEDSEKNEDENMTESIIKHSIPFTLKKLIRVLHIDSPTEHVMCLLGKKYPTNSEEFKISGLPGVWDSGRAGTRMKLPVPETWETQLPLHGNKASTWETLIDNNKLPYMATLRNIRNLVFSGISPMHHKKVIKHLENKKAVINSRQLPMQYFEAYKVLSGLADMYTSPSPKVVDSKDVPFWVKRQQKKWRNRLEEGSISIIEQYKTAVSNALEISSLNNLHPVPGKTLVICNIGSADSTNNLKLQSFETCIMMGLMCLKACENCKMNILCYSSSPDVISLNANDNFLDVLMETCSKYKKLLAGFQHSSQKNLSNIFVKVLDYYLRPQTILSLKLDHIILLQNSTEPFQNIMASFLNKYRQIVNPNLLYTDVNYSITGQRFSESHLSEKDVYLCGSSSSLIKFIAERSRGGQLEYIDNIDEKYNLPKIDEFKKHAPNADCNLLSTMPDKSSVVPIKCRMPKWHTVRIFISSTFKDMMSERDLLIRYVFPELNRRAASVFIRIIEIDLRWGITEADSSTKRAAELCLLEAQKADFFVGLIGDRYGTIYDFDSPDSAELQWINDGYEGLSITELEMHAAALRDPESKRKKAFFYIRNNSFLRNVPQKWKSHFDSEDFSSKAKVELLKNKIKSNNFKTLDGYTCHWAGIYENKPVLAGLDIFGNKVLEDLWEAVQNVHKKDPYFDNVEEEEIYQQNLIDSQHFYVGEKNAPIESTVKNLKLKHGVFVICGCCGSGKTAFSIRLLQHLKDFVLVKFFIGLSPRSRDLTYMLQFIVNSICQQLSISIALPRSPIDIVNQFPDILMEAAKYRRGKEIVLLIDGLDHLVEEDQKLDWLPLSLPDGVQLICTVSESSDAFKFLNSRQLSGNDIFIEELPLLQQTDRQKFIKDYLKTYSKTVDENIFNNYMLKFVTKKDSANPSYLRLVCDFLRIYASFDTLELMIQRIPSSLSSLFQEIILQMEKEFGSTLVQTVLILLCSTKEGLEDNDLHFILSFVMHINELNKSLTFSELKEKIKCLKPEQLICQVKYCSLMYVISTFAYGTIMGIRSFSLVSTEFENAVKKFYLNKNNASQSNFLHSVLAGYYYNICDPNNDGQYSQQSGLAIRSYLFHIFHASLYKELSDLLCNHKFLEAAFMTNTGAQLVEYFSSLLYDILPNNHKVSREINSNLLLTFNDFVTRNLHIFQQYPQLIMQQALNEPLDSSVCLQSEDCIYDFLENLSRSDIVDYRLASFCGFVKNITASASKKDQDFVVLGSQDGYLKVLDLSTFKVVRTIKGHVSTITCICFVGKNKMCVSSVDGTLSLWDSANFSRIAVLQGHRHSVTSCCGDPSGAILYSSGWDNSVRLWSLVDGREISVIDEFRSPVNCVDHHPLKQQIACGLWSGNIEIWDTVSLKKSLVIPCFSGSVKSLAYTPDGISIISSFIESEISIWSSEEGIKISNLKGHILPVKALSFSPDNSIFITGSDDCTLKVWSSTHGYFSTISDCKFCPISLMNFMSENLLAVAYQNSDMWIIDVNSGRVIFKTSLVADIVSAFSKYSRVAVDFTDSENNFIEKSVVFGTQAGKVMIGYFVTSSVSLRAEMNSKITAVIHNCDTIVCGTAEGDIGVFSYHDDIDSPDQMFRIISAAHRGFVSTFSLVVENEKLCVLSTANDNVLKIWHIDKDTCDVILVVEFLNRHKDGVTCSLFYPYCSDSSLFDNLYTGSHDNSIISWKNDTVKIFQGLHSSIVHISCFGDFILGCGNDGAIVIWSQNQKILSSVPGIELSSTILTFFVAEDDLNKFTVTLAYIDKDGSIKIKKPLQQTYSCTFEGHSKPVTSCCTSDSGNVVSCSLDGSVNLWKIPDNITDIQLMHSAVVTGVIISPSLEFAASSDAHGNLIFWKIDRTSSTTPLSYAGKKSYVGGFIRALSWMKDNKVAYAVTKHIEDNDNSYFVHVTSFEYILSNEVATFSFELKHSYFFESEVLSLHSSPNSDTVIVGLKSGYVSIINPETQYIVKISDDWLVGVKLFSRQEKSDLCSIALVDGSIRLYEMNDFIAKKTSVTPIEIYEPQPLSNDSKFVTSFCCGEGTLICVGDSGGVLRIYDEKHLKFIDKVHSDAISGICIAGSYIFTSSPDKTVKGWNLKSFKQICQFHSNAPISCLASADVCADNCDSTSYYLLIGTTSGNINLLKFHSK